MTPAPQKTELFELLGKLRDGELTDADTARLEQIIAADPSARRDYIDYVFLCASLRDHHEAAPQSADPDEQLAAVIARLPRATRWSIAAAILVTAAVIMTLMSNLGDRPNMNGSDGVAVLTRSVDTRWAAGSISPAVGSALPAGKLRLERGLAQIDFYSGASVILEGPAELDLISAQRGYFHFGKIRTHVPAQARGFTIGAPGVDVVDLGTEFGMRLEPSGKAEVHVFDGKVELHPQTSSDVRELKQGSAVAIDGVNVAGIRVNGEAFVDPARLDELAGGQLRDRQLLWSQWREQVRRDPAVIASFGFEEPHGWGRNLKNEVTTSVGDGAIVGCQWVSGRWPGRTALDFKRSSDRVRIDVPGEYDSLTFAAWVRVDGLDRWLSSLMLTDEWKHGNPHWQLSWDGEMILGVNGGPPNYTSPKGVVGAADLGRWIHLVTVYDGAAGVVTHYRDGHAVAKIPVKKTLKLKLGPAEIGNWARPEKQEKWLRNFNGRMDELIIWSRPVTAAEIKSMYEAGRPN